MKTILESFCRGIEGEFLLGAGTVEFFCGGKGSFCLGGEGRELFVMERILLVLGEGCLRAAISYDDLIVLINWI